MKSNTEQFIQKAIKVHGDKYNYSKVHYIGSKIKVIIICKIHGEFQQTPNIHLLGGNCPKCARNIITNKNRLSTEEFIKRSNKLHKNKYDYSKVKYVNSKTSVIIKCPIHGEFEQTADNHLSNYGCPQCGGSTKKDTDYFIKKAKKIHCDKYDYSKVIYKNSSTKVNIICPIHGEFIQTPNHHLHGRGCPYCAGNKIIKYNIIEKIVKNLKNDYIYHGLNHNKLIIECKKHGIFEQTYTSHIKGHGCPKCGIDKIKKLSRSTTEDFIKKAYKIHGNLYDYSNIIYINSNTKVNIICPVHGEFAQVPTDHLSGHGCAKCSLFESNPILEIKNMLNYYKINYKENDRKFIKPYEIDLFCYKNNIGVEFHGLHWHSYSSRESKKEKFKHFQKAELALNKNIILIQIFENEWAYKKDIVKSILINKLGINNNNNIYARSCTVLEINNQQYRNFMDLNHLQGNIGTKYKYGLFKNDELLMCIGLNKHHKYDFELMRVASKLNFRVVGGFSKLLNYHYTKYNGSIMTYCDRRYSDGNIYLKNKFVLSHITRPNYFYVKNKIVYSRQKFQKNKLKDKLQYFDEELSESQNMFNNGYRRIWDAGHFCFIKNDI